MFIAGVSPCARTVAHPSIKADGSAGGGTRAPDRRIRDDGVRHLSVTAARPTANESIRCTDRELDHGYSKLFATLFRRDGNVAGVTNVSAQLRNTIKRVPGAKTLYFKLAGLRLPRSTEDVFRHAITENKWGCNDSLSGGGSDLDQTRAIRDRLPGLWADLDVGTVLDLPCGDFFWMKHVPMDGIRYIGADILPELIQRNNDLYGRSSVTFRRIDLLQDRLPKVDLILCRDCLVHFSYRDVAAALRNICDSGSKYLLTTTFTERRNHDIATGQFRPLNLEVQPLSLPAPILRINEGCTERDGLYRDKSLGLWKVSDIRARLEGHHL
jgi:SAM-dependent methyltransferase